MNINKISKMDERCLQIERFLYIRQFSVSEGFFSDGEFRYKIFSSMPRKNIFFCLHILPTYFIEYIFGCENRQNSIRFWITEDKCEVPVDGFWVLKCD